MFNQYDGVISFDIPSTFQNAEGHCIQNSSTKLYGCEMWSLHLMKEHKLQVSENKVIISSLPLWLRPFSLFCLHVKDWSCHHFLGLLVFFFLSAEILAIYMGLCLDSFLGHVPTQWCFFAVSSLFCIFFSLLRIRPCGLFQFRITSEIMNH
jgi:hypothetical protein